MSDNLKFYLHNDLPKFTSSRLEYLREKVKELMAIPQPAQKSEEWYAFRDTMITASDWGTILGENHFGNKDQVLLKKCGENNYITNNAIKWGNKYEQVATMVYEFRNNVVVHEFGCIKHPTIGFLGASPDGITSDGVMLEIKCPSSREITGTPPSYYWCQVQGQLEVCELDRCDFLECKFIEYGGGEEEYLEDNFEGNVMYNKYGNEKGVIAEIFDKVKGDFIYVYGKVGLLGEELEEWKAKIISEYSTESQSQSQSQFIFASFAYWYLERVSCVPIYRNQEWFHKARIELEVFWNEILYYREKGLDKLKEDINEKKKTKIQKDIDNGKRPRKSSGPKSKNDTIYIDLNITDFKDDSVKLDVVGYNNAQLKMQECNFSLFSDS
jgi:putative phage-type endonuclease